MGVFSGSETRCIKVKNGGKLKFWVDRDGEGSQVGTAAAQVYQVAHERMILNHFESF